MRSSGRRLVFLFLAFGLIPVSRAGAELILWQDFNSAPSIASLIDATSSDTSRFYDIGTIPGDADGFSNVPGGVTEEQRLDGVGLKELVGGKLRISLRGAWRTYYTTGQSPTTRQRDSFASTGAVVRLLPFASRPDRLLWRFKLKSTAANLADSTAFVEGVSFAQVFAGKTLFQLEVDGDNRLRYRPGAGPDVIFDEEVEITVLINKTAGALDYTAPDTNPASVGAAAFDAWINDTLIINEGSHASNTALDNVQVAFTGKIGAAIENVGGEFIVPQSPGPPFEFELDDILMRSDFDPTVPSGAAAMSLSGSLNFDRKAAGSRTRKTFLIRNTGTAAMNVSRVVFPSPVFKGSFQGPIPAGGAGSVSVTFQPKKAKAYRGSVLVISDAPNSPGSLPISGTGRK